MRALGASISTGVFMVAVGRFGPTPAETDPFMVFLAISCFFVALATVVTDLAS